MNPHTSKLTFVRDHLTACADALRSIKDDSLEWNAAWSHTCNAHTEICMALDEARAAAGELEQPGDRK